jgi:hypothetical protein
MVRNERQIMTHKVDYELTKDKRGRKIAYKVDVVTGKKKRIGYKIAQKRQRDLKYRRKRDKVEGELKETGTGASYKEYKQVQKQVEKEIRAKYKKEKRSMPSDAVIRSRAKKTTLEYRTGVACRYRYAFVYWMRIGTDEQGKAICDTTPVMEAGALKRNGEDDYSIMVEVVMDVWNNIQSGIKSGDICDTGEYKVKGGLCVTLYEKNSKDILEQTERGEGCGYHFDFSGYGKSE